MRAEYVQHMGSDLTVVNAARVSFDKESAFEFDRINETWHLSQADAKLIKYLAAHNHWTPFSHAQITLRETVPIFVARQRFKHMVGFTYNEVSRRYVDSTPELYEPEVWRKRAENKKQGSSDEPVEVQPLHLSDCELEWQIDGIEDFHGLALSYYHHLLTSGVCPEQARMVLPQSMMTSYYVTGSLAAFARAYKLRSDPHSQVEIQQLAKEWDRIIRPLYPNAWSALADA